MSALTRATRRLMRAPIARHRAESTARHRAGSSRAERAAVAESRHIREQAARDDDLARGALVTGTLTVDGRTVA